MSYKRLFIFVEGPNDKRFFSDIIKPILKNVYNWVDIIEYARETEKRRKSFINGIKSMNADYLFIGDINTKPCITAKKEYLIARHGNIDSRKILIVVKEIESWYLAGLREDGCRKLGLSSFMNTNDLTKEDFNSLQPKKFDSKIDFMVEIINNFCLDTAKIKNLSFKYFCKNYLLKPIAPLRNHLAYKNYAKTAGS